MPLRSEFASTGGFKGADDPPFDFEDVLLCGFGAENPSLFGFGVALPAKSLDKIFIAISLTFPGSVLLLGQ